MTRCYTVTALFNGGITKDYYCEATSWRNALERAWRYGLDAWSVKLGSVLVWRTGDGL